MNQKENTMSDPEKTPKSDQEAPKQTPELSEDEMKGVVGGAVDAYLNIDGIKGESTDDKYKDWIEVLDTKLPT
jgi:type VI protein secretion system component Hcp